MNKYDWAVKQAIKKNEPKLIKYLEKMDDPEKSLAIADSLMSLIGEIGLEFQVKPNDMMLALAIVLTRLEYVYKAMEEVE